MCISLRSYNENDSNKKVGSVQRYGPGELIDKIVSDWFNRVRFKNAPVFGSIVQAQVLEVAREI